MDEHSQEWKDGYCQAIFDVIEKLPELGRRFNYKDKPEPRYDDNNPANKQLLFG